MVQTLMVGKSGVENSCLKNLGLKYSWLKLGVEKSGVEMSFNQLLAYHGIQIGEKLIDNSSEISMMSIFIAYKCKHNS